MEKGGILGEGFVIDRDDAGVGEVVPNPCHSGAASDEPVASCI